MDIPSKRFQGEQGSYSASSIISGTAGEQSISHKLREQTSLFLREFSSLHKVQVGDVVCIHETTIPRQLWRLGEV